jgi:hypothetical protein
MIPENMKGKTPLEILNEVKDAIDFQLIVAKSTGASNISLSYEQALVCYVAIERLITEHREEKK